MRLFTLLGILLMSSGLGFAVDSIEFQNRSEGPWHIRMRSLDDKALNRPRAWVRIGESVDIDEIALTRHPAPRGYRRIGFIIKPGWKVSLRIPTTEARANMGDLQVEFSSEHGPCFHFALLDLANPEAESLSFNHPDAEGKGTSLDPVSYPPDVALALPGVGFWDGGSCVLTERAPEGENESDMESTQEY